jgi:hypothetical protein
VSVIEESPVRTLYRAERSLSVADRNGKQRSTAATIAPAAAGTTLFFVTLVRRKPRPRVSTSPDFFSADTSARGHEASFGLHRRYVRVAQAQTEPFAKVAS